MDRKFESVNASSEFFATAEVDAECDRMNLRSFAIKGPLLASGVKQYSLFCVQVLAKSMAARPCNETSRVYLSDVYWNCLSNSSERSPHLLHRKLRASARSCTDSIS